jgi:cytochrome c oxidase cbb3-type subunit IV
MDLQSLYAFLRPAWIIWFMAMFILIVAWALWPRNRGRFDADARIPFKED